MDMAFNIEEHLLGVSAFIGGTANVIMQLARREVAYGVMESTVTSGNVFHNPFKRLRTTLTYLAVAMLGSDAERAAYRDAINQVHKQVKSTPQSPVRYNAFDKELQRWVAACLYFGSSDLIEKISGPMSAETADAFYAHSVRLGSTLQMPEGLWPKDRHAFAAYWQEALATLEIDARTRAYLHALIDLKMLPKPLQLLAPLHRFWVTGCLPERLREQMQLPFSSTQERCFKAMLRALGQVMKYLPRALRQFPLNYYLWDFRRRLRQGQRWFSAPPPNGRAPHAVFCSFQLSAGAYQCPPAAYWSA